MRSGSATGSRGRPRAGPSLGGALGLAVLGLLALMLTACSASSKAAGGSTDQKTILLTKRGETSIQVTESEENGDQIVRVNTVVRGQRNTIKLDIDQPVYEVQIPLDIEQVIPQSSGAQPGGTGANFKDLLFAQYMQRAQQDMTSGDYNGALKEVDTVLQIDPNNVKAHSMKGSVYYALGNYDLANQEWKTVLDLDPTNQEVLNFQEFLRNHASGKPPKLPGAPEGTQGAAAPGGAGTGAAGGGTSSGSRGGAAPQPPPSGQGGTQQ